MKTLFVRLACTFVYHSAWLFICFACPFANLVIWLYVYSACLYVQLHLCAFRSTPSAFTFQCLLDSMSDRLCGLVVRVSGYRYRGLGFDSRRYQIF